MSKINKIFSINLLSLMGWLNFLVWFYVLKDFFSIKADLLIDTSTIDSMHWLFMFGVALNLTFIGFSLLSVLIEYILKLLCFKLPFNFPVENIKKEKLYLILFYIGLVLVFVPLAFPFIFL